MLVDEPCPSCEYYNVCGGRCLFANKQRLWGEEGFTEVCDTVKHLIDELKKIQPSVENLIRRGVINEKEFNYPEYNNGCEIIP